METCEHCGMESDDIEIEHRGCRLKAAFPGTYEREGGLLSFDMEKIREQIERDGAHKS